MLLLSVLLASGQPAHSDPPNLVVVGTEKLSRITRLDNLLGKRKYNDINVLLASADSKETASEDLLWLRDRSINSPSAFINFTYARILWAALGQQADPRLDQARQTAAAMLIYTTVVFDIDGARCSDHTAPSDRLNNIMSQNYPILEYARKTSIENKQQIIRIVTRLDQKNASERAENFDSEFLCTGGLQHMAHMMEHGNSKERPAREGEVGRQIELSDGDEKYVPPLKDKEDWLKVAADKRTKLQKWLFNLLEKPEN
ncbi:hypothetical protein [Parasphingorhabdus sp.]|uniref:hypothetical protein n=1 Tax=Parasphingorhabdus sp. TaxID=2709688 RepID=UPI00326471A9